jgi:hypothetical protein
MQLDASEGKNGRKATMLNKRRTFTELKSFSNLKLLELLGLAEPKAYYSRQAIDIEG